MLVTISRWLVMFGLDCEKAFRPRWAERKGGERACRVRHLEEEKAGGQGWTGCRQQFPQWETFLYIRGTMLKTVTR